MFLLERVSGRPLASYSHVPMDAMNGDVNVDLLIVVSC
jgi:hypothetical protein